ncbi:hypothetical protein HHA03_24330 [Halolactibacillus halophilus]|uniref:Uncharacterized protein n=1 Tax=Halolactibacillus halophilus TaxID=306540 RepID=A0ABQ0VP56_9BACI|nr:hypothetical protein HHA03_24330 [Halolactibacillus halophilus]
MRSHRYLRKGLIERLMLDLEIIRIKASVLVDIPGLLLSQVPSKQLLEKAMAPNYGRIKP